MEQTLIAASGLVVGGVISWLTTNSRLRREVGLLYDRALLDRRLSAYETLWRKTKGVPQIRLMSEVTGASLLKIREDWHDWYYEEGGIFMSAATRKRYYNAIAKLEEVGRRYAGAVPPDADYRRVYGAVKALRDQMAEDLGARSVRREV